MVTRQRGFAVLLSSGAKPGKSPCCPGEEALQGVLPRLPRHGGVSRHLLAEVAGWVVSSRCRDCLLPAQPAGRETGSAPCNPSCGLAMSQPFLGDIAWQGTN